MDRYIIRPSKEYICQNNCNIVTLGKHVKLSKGEVYMIQQTIMLDYKHNIYKDGIYKTTIETEFLKRNFKTKEEDIIYQIDMLFNDIFFNQ